MNKANAKGPVTLDPEEDLLSNIQALKNMVSAIDDIARHIEATYYKVKRSKYHGGRNHEACNL